MEWLDLKKKNVYLTLQDYENPVLTDNCKPDSKMSSVLCIL